MDELECTLESPRDDDRFWYAIQTRPRHEKRVHEGLRSLGFWSFLPMVEQVHQWSDRRQKVQVPLFSRYLFIQSLYNPEVHQAVIKLPGVNGFVGASKQALPIPNSEIATIQLLLSRRIPVEPHPFLKVGQRVRCRGGALDGLEGILVSKKKDYSVVVSIELLQRSVSVHINGYDLEPVREPRPDTGKLFALGECSAPCF